MIKRHHFSSDRASHGNSRSHNTPGSISMAQDPGRVFPGKRMAGHYGNVTRTIQKLQVVRVDAERGLLLVKGSVPGADGDAHRRPPVGQGWKERAGEEGSVNGTQTDRRQGAKASTVAASDALFGRDYNEALIHQVVDRLPGQARQGTRAQKGRGEVDKSHQEAVGQKGTGRARAGRRPARCGAAAARSSRTSPDENFTQKVNRKMYRAGIASILSQLVRERPPVGDRRPDGRIAEDQAVRAEDQGHGPRGTVLVITDKLDENLFLSSRNLPNVLVLETPTADPVSLVRFNNVLLTAGRGRAIRGDAGMNATTKLQFRAPDEGAAGADDVGKGHLRRAKSTSR